MSTTTRNLAAPAAAALLQEIGPAVCAELQRINGTLQGELLDGVANIVAGIRRSERGSAGIHVNSRQKSLKLLSQKEKSEIHFSHQA